MFSRREVVFLGGGFAKVEWSQSLRCTKSRKIKAKVEINALLDLDL